VRANPDPRRCPICDARRRTADDVLACVQAHERTRTINGVVIHTEYVHPPVPWRGDDWSAITDDYDGAPDAGPQLHGTGPTENAAVADLMEQIAEREAT